MTNRHASRPRRRPRRSTPNNVPRRQNEHDATNDSQRRSSLKRRTDDAANTLTDVASELTRLFTTQLRIGSRVPLHICSPYAASTLKGLRGLCRCMPVNKNVIVSRRRPTPSFIGLFVAALMVTSCGRKATVTPQVPPAQPAAVPTTTPQEEAAKVFNVPEVGTCAHCGRERRRVKTLFGTGRPTWISPRRPQQSATERTDRPVIVR